MVPKTYDKYTSRKVLTTGWVDGEKLSQSTESDVGELVNVGVICYLKQVSVSIKAFVARIFFFGDTLSAFKVGTILHFVKRKCSLSFCSGFNVEHTFIRFPNFWFLFCFLLPLCLIHFLLFIMTAFWHRQRGKTCLACLDSCFCGTRELKILMKYM